MKTENKEWTIWRATFPAVVQSLAAWQDPHAGTAVGRYLTSSNEWEQIAARDAQVFFNRPMTTVNEKLKLIQNEVWLYKYFTISYRLQ